MVREEKRNMVTGLLGTLAFHLILLIGFLTLKIGEVKTKHRELIAIEFTEEEYKSIEEIIKESAPVQEEITPLSQQSVSNIASNVADEMNEEINTDKYIEELMEEMGIEDLTPEHDNSLPDDPMLFDDTEKNEDEVKTNFGHTRIMYNVPPDRKARHIDRPIYRCQGGGEVIISVLVSPEGHVVQASVKSSNTNENCILEMAINSAQNFLFEKDNSADKRVAGTISYIFVAQ